MPKLTPFAALKLIASSEFRDFSASDWDGFAGCESKNPLIAVRGDGSVIIIDECRGDSAYAEFYDSEGRHLLSLDVTDMYPEQPDEGSNDYALRD